MSELGEVKGSLALAMSSISPNRTPVGWAGALPSSMGAARMGARRRRFLTNAMARADASGRPPVSWTSRP